MGMSHCTRTGHSLVPGLFQDAARRKPTAPGWENNPRKRKREQTLSSLECWRDHRPVVEVPGHHQGEQ